jgi:GT2 family glycosyltransferase
VAFPVGCYDQFRELFDVPDPPPTETALHFSIYLLADREPLETLRLQIAKIAGQNYPYWSLRVIGTDAARRRVTDQLAAAEPRIGWCEMADGELEAEAERRAALHTEGDWLVFLTRGALLHAKTLGWFAAASGVGTAAAFVTDEERIIRHDGKVERSAPEFRQVVDYDTLLEANPFGETIAVRRQDYAGVADRLVTSSPAASRSALLLSLACCSQIGHIPCALVARDATIEFFDAEQAATHHEAVGAHLHSSAFNDIIDVQRSAEPGTPLRIRWRVQSPDTAIAVIIPTRDNGDDLFRCVDSLRAKAAAVASLQILIVDNGTKQPRSQQALTEIVEKGWAEVLAVDEPFNWSRLNNLAVRRTTAPLVLFANDDIVAVSDDWDIILRGLLERPQIGAVGARLLYPNDTLQHGGVLFGWPNLTIHDGLYEHCSAKGPASRWRVTRRVSAVTGAFLATRRDLFLAHGGFDEIALPIQYSDIDYALKLRAAGRAILWTPEITCRHHESRTRGLDHLVAEQRARVSAEQAIIQERWGGAFESDPSVNPIWCMATLPFRLMIAAPRERIMAHIRRCAAPNPWAVP